MKYFTADLLKRFASREDAVAEAAEAEWARNRKIYRKRLQAIKSRLPKPVQRFLKSYNLHDAQLLAFEVGKKDDTLSLLFQLDGSEEGLQLTYWVDRARSQFILPRNGKGPAAVEWLYDEIDVLDKGLFKHSILLTGGVELGLAFSKLELHPLDLGLKIRPGRVRAFCQEVRELAS